MTFCFHFRQPQLSTTQCVCYEHCLSEMPQTLKTHSHKITHTRHTCKNLNIRHGIGHNWEILFSAVYRGWWQNNSSFSLLDLKENAAKKKNNPKKNSTCELIRFCINQVLKNHVKWAANTVSMTFPWKKQVFISNYLHMLFMQQGHQTQCGFESIEHIKFRGLVQQV